VSARPGTALPAQVILAAVDADRAASAEGVWDACVQRSDWLAGPDRRRSRPARRPARPPSPRAQAVQVTVS